MTTFSTELPPSLIDLVIADRYEIIDELGAGGMAHVFEATDRQSDRRVAVKFLSAHYVDVDGVAERFEREYLTLSSLDHNNIVKVYDYGILEDVDGLARRQPYIVMEYLPYPDLNTILHRKKRISEKGTLVMALQLADAFTHIHPQGLVHRDVKPSNILVTPQGRPILLDFGLVRNYDLTTLTQTGQVIGTPQFLAPEQLLGERVDGRCDLHQFGAVLYECLTGAIAFSGSDLHRVAGKILSRERPRLATAAPDIGPAWDDVIARAMAREVDHRYPDAGAMKADLEHIAAHGSCQALPVRQWQRKAAARSAGGGTFEAGSGKADHAAAAAGGRTGRDRAGAREQQRERRPQGLASPPGSARSALPRSAWRRSTAAWCLVVFLAGLTVTVLFGELVDRLGSGTPTAAGVTARRLQTGPGWLEIRWRSERPYPSLVRLSNFVAAPHCLATTAVERCFSSDDGVPVTEHAVRCGGLGWAARCQYELVFPDGQSTARETARIQAIVPTFVRATSNDNLVTLDWQLNHVDRAQVELRSSTGQVIGSVAATQTTTAAWQAVIPRHDPKLVALGSTCRDGSRLCHSLASLVNECGRTFIDSHGSFEAAATARRLWEEVLQWSATKPKGIVPTLDQRFHRLFEITNGWRQQSGVGDDYRRLAPSLSLLMSRHWLPFPLQRALYRLVTDYTRLSIFSPEVFGGKSFLLTPLPDLGRFALSLESRLAHRDRVIAVHDGLLRLRVSTAGTKKDHQIERESFMVDDLDSIDRASLLVELSTPGSNALKIVVNDEPTPLYIYDRALLEARGRSPYAGVDRLLGKLWDNIDFHQSIPRRYLRKGRNELRYEAVNLSSNEVTWNLLRLQRVELHLQLER